MEGTRGMGGPVGGGRVKRWQMGVEWEWAALWGGTVEEENEFGGRGS